jgi:hypothetical protein
MVLGPQGPGRVGRCQAGELRKAPFLRGAFLFAEKDWQASLVKKKNLLVIIKYLFGFQADDTVASFTTQS